MPQPFSALCITGPKAGQTLEAATDTLQIPKPLNWGDANWGDTWGSKILIFRYLEIDETLSFWIPQEEYENGIFSAIRFVLKETSDVYALHVPSL